MNTKYDLYRFLEGGRKGNCTMAPKEMLTKDYWLDGQSFVFFNDEDALKSYIDEIVYGSNMTLTEYLKRKGEAYYSVDVFSDRGFIREDRIKQLKMNYKYFARDFINEFKFKSLDDIFREVQSQNISEIKGFEKNLAFVDVYDSGYERCPVKLMDTDYSFIKGEIKDNRIISTYQNENEFTIVMETPRSFESVGEVITIIEKAKKDYN